MVNEFVKNGHEIISEPQVENAAQADIDAISSIQSERLIIPETNLDKSKTEEGGFLVYPISNEELEELIRDGMSHMVKVAKLENKTVGYIISYDMKAWEAIHPDWFSRLQATTEEKTLLKNQPVLYGRHIAVDQHVNTSSKIGQKLLNATLEEAMQRGYVFYVVEVLKEPIANKRSANFVDKAGFRLIGETKDEKSRVWSVFVKNLS